MTVQQINEPGRKQQIAREILEVLTDWFENPEAREGYIRESWDSFA